PYQRLGIFVRLSVVLQGYSGPVLLPLPGEGNLSVLEVLAGRPKSSGTVPEVKVYRPFELHGALGKGEEARVAQSGRFLVAVGDFDPARAVVLVLDEEPQHRRRARLGRIEVVGVVEVGEIQVRAIDPGPQLHPKPGRLPARRRRAGYGR